MKRERQRARAHEQENDIESRETCPSHTEPLAECLELCFLFCQSCLQVLNRCGKVAIVLGSGVVAKKRIAQLLTWLV